jgi:rod shape-determining protein MreD
MQYGYDRTRKKDLGIKYVLYALAAILIAFFHVVLSNLIAIGGITPNLMIILVVWITLKRGQFVGLFAGFLGGMIYDIVTMDVIGTNALSQTVMAFVTGFFYREGKEEHTVKSMKFLGILFFACLVHNLIYYFFYIKLSDLSFWNFFFKYGIAGSLYTTVIGIFAMFIKIPGRQINI